VSDRFDVTKLPIVLVRFLHQHPEVALFLEENPEYRPHLFCDPASGEGRVSLPLVAAMADWMESNGMATPETAEDLRSQCRAVERSARYERN
jgi:hypothetical protein